MSRLPTYQEALRQLETLKSTPTPLEVQCMAQKAMENELAKSEITSECLKEVKQLVDNVIKIDQAFERVKTDLGKIDNSNLNIICKPAEKLQPAWMSLHQRFVILLWDSRATARKTGAYIKEFVNVILPGLEDIRSNADYRNAFDDLKEFVARKDPFRGKLDSKDDVNQVQKQSLPFNDLQCDIVSFKHRFELFATGQGAELHEDIVNLYGVIDGLNMEIECCETMILDMSMALGVTIPAVGTGSVVSLAALGLVGPVTTHKIFFAGATAALIEFKDLIAFVSKSNEYQEGISSARTQVNDLKAKTQVLERIQVTLMDHEAEIADACARIDRFAAIWFHVTHDAELIATDLKAVVRPEGDLSRKAFVARLKLVRRTYATLANVLREYTSQIDRHSFRFAQGCFV